MKNKNMKFAGLLLAMVCTTQAGFAIDNYTDLNAAIQSNTTPITLTGNITTDNSLSAIVGTATAPTVINGGSYSISGTNGTSDNKGFTIGSGKGLTLDNTTLSGFTTAIDNSGTLTLNNVTISAGTTGVNNTFSQTNGSTTLTGTNTINSNISGTGSITNNGSLTIAGNNSGYTGNYTQSNTGTSTTVTGTFFGGSTSTTSTISNGTLNWHTTSNIPNSTKLVMSGTGTTLNVGANTTQQANLNINSGSSISGDVSINVLDKSKLSVSGGTVGLNNNDNIKGSIELTSGTVNIDNVNNNNFTGALNATGGNLKLNTGTFVVNNKSSIGSGTTVDIKGSTILEVAGDATNKGSVYLDNSDTWTGDVKLSGGELTVSNRTANGKLLANSGNLTIQSGSLSIASGSNIDTAVNTTVTGTLNIADGTVAIDTGDTWSGTINLNSTDGSGVLDYSGVKADTANGKIVATKGHLNINSGTLNVSNGSSIAEDVTTKIASTSKLNINGGNVTLNNGDEWSGNVTLSSGTLTVNNINNGTLTASSGKLDLKAGDLTLDSNSSVGTSVETVIGANSTLNVAGATVDLGNNDTWTGNRSTVNVTDGTLNLNITDKDGNGVITATGGNVNLETGDLNIASGSNIGAGAKVTLAANTTTTISDNGKLSLDSATADAWNSTAEINLQSGTLTLDGLTANGIINATGGKVEINSGNLTVEGTNSNINANEVAIAETGSLTLKKDTTVKNITGNGTLAVNNSKLTFNNSSTFSSDLKFNSTNSSTVDITAKADSVLDLITKSTSSNSGLTINIDGTDATKDLTIDGTNISNLNFKNTVNYSGELTNNGTTTNTDDLTLGGAITGSGTFTNSKNVTLNSNASGFTGTYKQTAGSTTVNSGGKVFGGVKNIDGGSLNIASANSIDYTNVNLGNGASLTHTIKTADNNVVNSDVVKFTGSNATATFKADDGVKANIELDSNITGDGSGNKVVFDNINNLTLGLTDYTGKTEYKLINGTDLNLIETDANASTDTYNFAHLTTDKTATLSFNVNIVDGANVGEKALTTDRVIIGDNNNTQFKIGNIYISGEENGSRNVYTTTNNVLSGASFTGTPTIIGATTSWIYDVTLANSNQSISMKIRDYVNENTLNDMNITEGTRFFQFSTGKTEPETYHVGGALGATAGQRADVNSPASFTVTGNGIDKSIISAAVIDETKNLTGERVSLFNIASGKDVKLDIKNVTIQDAQKTGNGSVVENNSEKAIVTLNSVKVTNNEATNGGAIYNGVMPNPAEDVNGDKIANLVITDSVLTNNTADENGGAIYNAGNMVVSKTTFENNKATQGGAIYNSGKMTLNNVTVKAGTDNAANDIYQNAGDTVLTGTNTIDSNIAGTGSITNDGILNISGDNSKYTGTYTQTAADTKTTVTGTFFGGTSTISDGTLNWHTTSEIPSTSTLNISGEKTKLNIGKDENQKAVLAINNGSKIEKAVTTTIAKNSVLNIGTNGTVELNGNDSWLGEIKITDGQLDLDGMKSNNKLTATDGGIINLKSGNLDITNGSTIAGNSVDENGESIANSSTSINIAKNANLNIRGGEVTINDNDKWEGFINLKSGTLNIEETSEGILHADGGNLKFSTGTLTIKDGSYINGEVVINLPGANAESGAEASIIEIMKGGTVAVTDNDIWDGEVHLNGGVLNYGTQRSGTLVAKEGVLNLLNGSVLNIQVPSQVEDNVEVHIKKGALVNLKKEAVFHLVDTDEWNGMINNDGGELITTGLTNSTEEGGGLQQTLGSSTFQDGSEIRISDATSYITGGDVNILNKSSLWMGSETAELSVDNLRLSQNSTLDMMNNKINTTKASNMIVDDRNNVRINISPRDWKNDKFVIDTIKADKGAEGTINVSKFDFLGLCPIDRHIELQIFDVKSIENVKFDATDQQIFTPIGWYDLQAMGGGTYTSNLTKYNPQVFRGQVATMAMWNNQMAIDDMLLNHVSLSSERLLAQGFNANRYALNESQFAPYQYKKEDGGLWFKSYVNIEKLSMNWGLNVHNNSYGSIVGADFPVVNMKRGWKFLPTAYVGYNGSHQSFNRVGMYQNGGQAGFMGTFMKDDFIGSVLAYGGGYNNEMSVEGFTDKTANWFAGAAAKAAYNLHATKHFTVQPSLMLAYNIFGRQNWTTDFGIMGMGSGYLNGMNVAPGVNFIYARETWNLYATFQYMYNINDHVDGRAGNVALSNVDMRHGYFQYGFGANKTWKDRLTSYVQLVFRNGGRTGIGFQLGAQYLFDWTNPHKSKSKKLEKVQSQPNKTQLKSLSMK